jgi:histidine triad (HIT) family protein
MENCIFCKIASGQIPAATLYEDEHVMAFLDIGPLSEGHTLVIPKTHVEQMDQAASETVERIARVLPMLTKAVKAATAADGCNILNNNGRVAGQAVDHMHFHIIPRRQGDGLFPNWPAGKYPPGKAEAIADKIRKAIRLS